MQLSELASLVNGILRGVDKDVSHFSIDTRTLNQEDVYIAIHGERCDGHDFIEEAMSRGAAALIVDHDVHCAVPIMIVSDTLNALHRIAEHHRDQMHVHAVAITGSCGKTTTRALLESICSDVASTHASAGSFNNHIGVPLTLLQLKPSDHFLVSEVGANHTGEIAELISLVKPDVAVITNAAAAHLEGFGSIENVSKAKAEIYSGLSEKGVAIINADDVFADLWRKINVNRCIMTFGILHPADVMACDISFDSSGFPSFTLHVFDEAISITLPLLGRHNVCNALAAAAAAHALGISLHHIKRGLEHALSVSHRLNVKKIKSGVLIDDSYNANPSSVSAAIQVLAQKTGDTVLVLGDMKELGVDAEKCHIEIGHQAKLAGIKRLFCYGHLTRFTAQAFGEGASHFTDKKILIERLKSSLKDTSTVLVKGSHSMGMKDVSDALIEGA